MEKRHLPSIEALTSADDELLMKELRLSEVRDHVEVARILLDEVERLVPPSDRGQPPVSGQMAEELARLGCKMVELATVLGRGQPSSTRFVESARAAV
jgi:hypothetical protein